MGAQDPFQPSAPFCHDSRIVVDDQVPRAAHPVQDGILPDSQFALFDQQIGGKFPWPEEQTIDKGGRFFQGLNFVKALNKLRGVAGGQHKAQKERKGVHDP